MKTNPLILTTALLGVVVGLGTAYMTRCPEARYPACYHESIQQGFNVFDGVAYAVQHDWQPDGGLILSVRTNVACMVGVRLFVGQFPEGMAPEVSQELGKTRFAYAQTVEIDDVFEVKIPADKFKKGYKTFLSIAPVGEVTKMFKDQDLRNIYLERR